MVGEFEVGTQREEETENNARESISYQKLYQVSQRYDIFRIPVYRFEFTAILYS